MRLPGILLTLAVLAVEWVASSPISAKSTGNTNKNEQLLNYFSKLLPVANHTILYELGGPEIGAAVNQHPLSARPMSYPLIYFYF